MRILAINPGSTSTKFSVFDNNELVLDQTVRHSTEEISKYPKILDQYEFRRDLIIKSMEENHVLVSSLDAVVGRGGLLKPIPGGVYKVNDTLLEDLRKEMMGEHASNLGGILAYEIAKLTGKNVDSFIVDPVVVDELQDLARLSGHPELPRVSIFHALNQKAVARRYARETGAKYEDLSLIVAHLGGGITVGVHYKGKVIDVNNGLDGEGPYSPERSGTLPAGALAKLCYAKKYQLVEVRKMITGRGGMVAYLGTNSAMDVEKRTKEGDKEAERIYKGIAYQVAKEIGACSAVLSGKVDAILITGGLAYSDILTKWISERVEFISKVCIYPGEDETRALAESVFFAINGEQEIKVYN